MTPDLKRTLALHLKWLRREPGGMRADLSEATLSGADLSGATLSGADLSWADLYGADLSGATLSGADLSWADLYGADLSGADLSGADLSGADLSGADLSGAALYRATLSGAIGIEARPIYADAERHYVLWLIKHHSIGIRFIAGCRNFGPEEAIKWWGPDHRPQPAYVSAIQEWLPRVGYQPKATEDTAP